ncbi:MAG: hypothetical protein DWI00_14740, partial [Planctomycetota bacterium]
FLWSGAAFDDNADHNFARPFHESIKLLDEEGKPRPGFTTKKAKAPNTEAPAVENSPVPAPSDDDLAPPAAPVAAPVDPFAPPAPVPAPAPPM